MTIIRRDATAEQRLTKRLRDDRYALRIDASIAAEIEEVGRQIQVEFESERWDALDERAHDVLRRVEAIVRESEDWADITWVERQAEILASADESSRIVAALEYKRTRHQHVRANQPSAFPARIPGTPSTNESCRETTN